MYLCTDITIDADEHNRRHKRNATAFRVFGDILRPAVPRLPPEQGVPVLLAFRHLRHVHGGADRVRLGASVQYQSAEGRIVPRLSLHHTPRAGVLKAAHGRTC